MIKLEQEVISFFDNHHIGYAIRNNSIYLTNSELVKIRINSKQIRIYVYSDTFREYNLYKKLYSLNEFVDYIMYYINNDPSIIELKSKLSMLEDEYQSLTEPNSRNAHYSTNVLSDQIKYMEELIDELYTPNGNLSVYYEQLFYSIIN